MLTAATIWCALIYRTWISAPPEPVLSGDRVAIGFIALIAFGALFLASSVSYGRSRAQNLRRLLVLLEVVAALVAYACLRDSAVIVLLAVVVVQLVRLFEVWTSLVVAAAANVVLFLLVAQRLSGQEVLETVVFFGSLQLFTFMTATYASNASKARDALVRVNAELLATRGLLRESARLDERLRLSRELHDLIGYKLTALKLQMRQLMKDPRPEDKIAAASCSKLTDELLTDIRGVVSASRYGEGIDLRESLATLMQSLPGPNIELHLPSDGIRVPRLDQANVLLRCAQEGLTNAIRHADAENIVLSLELGERSITLTIEDDGRNQTTPTRGNGLTGLQERLLPLGGSLELTRPKRRGMQLKVWMPTEEIDEP